MTRRFLSPWQCDSDSDYYAQFEEPEYEPDEPEEDCPYHCSENLEVVWEVQQ